MNEKQVLKLADECFGWEASPIGGLWYADKDALVIFATACEKIGRDAQRESDAELFADEYSEYSKAIRLNKEEDDVQR